MADQTATPSHDPVITSLVDRAKSLRVPINEMCDAAGESPVTVWRWQYRDTATWKRRDAFIKAATAFLDAEQAKYADL